MKKLGLMALAAVLVVAFTVPAWAMESQFGGYWRTRMWMQENFTGEDETEAEDLMAVDTRTRLYYTAVFHENLKFVNKFEFDAAWGTEPLGDIGADGKEFEIKNSYADFNMGPVNAKVGIQGAKLARGFLFDDDFSGAVVSFNGPGFSIPLIWMKAWEGGPGKDANDYDVDYYGIAPVFNIGDNIKISPYGLYAYSDNASGWKQVPALSTVEELNMWFAGVDVDVKFDMFSAWATGIYQGGDATVLGADDITRDFAGFLAAAGFDMNMTWGGLHGQFFYATGQDPEEEDFERFWVPKGQSYYWSEIMGYGIFGDTSYANVSNNACYDQISNIMAGNFGVTVKPMGNDVLKITLDGWYAALAEDITVNGSDENYLGTEIDLIITYQLTKGLNLDIVGAYLIAGEATTMDHPDEADPYEVGTRLSLSF
ncbi:MAG: hypothetical protein AB7S75_02315 [Desulfococcaceae bacterium]